MIRVLHKGLGWPRGLKQGFNNEATFTMDDKGNGRSFFTNSWGRRGSSVFRLRELGRFGFGFGTAYGYSCRGIPFMFVTYRRPSYIKIIIPVTPVSWIEIINFEK